MALIEKTDKRYLRRMVREIRGSFQFGVYVYNGNAESHRVTEVKMSGSALVYRLHVDDEMLWHAVRDIDSFKDGYGRQIVASREV